MKVFGRSALFGNLAITIISAAKIQKGLELAASLRAALSGSTSLIATLVLIITSV